MATTTTSYGPNANGITYTIAVTPGFLGIDSDTLTVTDAAGTLHGPITGLNDGEIDTVATTPGTINLTGVLGLGNTTGVIVPGAVAQVNVLGVGSALSLYVGGTAIINTDLAALTGLTVYVDGGAASLTSTVSALGGSTINLDNGGSFTAAGGLATILNGTTINFGTGGGTLIANGNGALVDLSGTTITGFQAGIDKIEFVNLPAAVTEYTISAPTGGGVQTITLFNGTTVIGTTDVTGSNLNGGVPITVTAGQAGPLTIAAGGTEVTVTPVPSTLCFLAGTMIATPDGEAAIETLKPGDLVLTADGRTVPVRWIGINTVATRFADPQRNMPIHIMPGALGEGLPKRDLKLSPDHALLLDGILVQAGALLNNVTIHRVGWMPEQFRYYHIETAAHDLILAEGVAAETFVDNVSRMAFDNWQEFLDICDGEPPTGEMAYPRAKSQRQLPPLVRARLATRAAQLQAQTAA